MASLIRFCGGTGSTASVSSSGRRSLLQQATCSATKRKPASGPAAPVAAITTSALSNSTKLLSRSFAGSKSQRHVLRGGGGSGGVAIGAGRVNGTLPQQFSSMSGSSPLVCKSLAARYSVMSRRGAAGETGRELVSMSAWQPPLSALPLPRSLHQQQKSMMSTGASGGGAQGDPDAESGGREEKFEGEQPPPEQQPGSSAKDIARLFMLTCGTGLAVVCGYFIMAELMPSRMSVSTVMNDAHNAFLADPDTANHFGTPLKAYGRDTNRQREGRRNFVDHEKYDEKDGSSRTRLRFNVEGPHGHGMAFAEVSNKMSSGEWVYLCVQDMQTGHVITLHDNRAMLAAQSQADSQEEKDAFAAMLGKRS